MCRRLRRRDCQSGGQAAHLQSASFTVSPQLACQLPHLVMYQRTSAFRCTWWHPIQAPGPGPADGLCPPQRPTWVPALHRGKQRNAVLMHVASTTRLTHLRSCESTLAPARPRCTLQGPYGCRGAGTCSQGRAELEAELGLPGNERLAVSATPQEPEAVTGSAYGSQEGRRLHRPVCPPYRMAWANVLP